MPRDLTRERHAAHYICTSDACNQGRISCPVPQACEVSERSWFWNDLTVIAIGALCLIGWIAGVFA